MMTQVVLMHVNLITEHDFSGLGRVKGAVCVFVCK